MKFQNLTKYLFILLSVTLLVTGCGGAEERKAVYFEKAIKSKEAGDLEKARIELKNVLQIDPKFGEAYFLLGQIYEQQKNYRKAFTNYTKAAKLTPDNFENQAKLGRFLLLLARDIDKAKEKMDLILEKDPENIHGRLLKAAILTYEGNVDEAIFISKDLFDSDASYVENAIFLSTMYLRKKQTDDSIDVLEKSLSLNEGNEQITSILGKILILNKDYDRAEDIYKDKLSRHPDSFSSYTGLASFYKAKGDDESLIATLRDAIANDPEDVDRQLTLVKFIQATKGNDEAKKELDAMIATSPDLGKLRIALGTVYILSGEPDEAKKVFIKAIKDFPEDSTGIDARGALAGLHLQEKNLDKAKKVLEEAIAISPNDPKINMLVAKLALMGDDYENAIIALRIVVNESPENIDAYFLLAMANDKQGKTEEAKSIINTAYENNRANTEVLLKLAKYYAGENNVEKTEQVIDSYLAVDGTNYEALSIKAVILNKAKKYGEVKPYVERMVELYPDKANGYIQSLPYLVKEEKTSEAVTLLKEGYDKVEDNRLIMKLLTTVQIKSGELDEAEARLVNALEASPDDVELHSLVAKMHLVKKQFDKAKVKLKDVIRLDPSNEESYLLLADIYSKESNQKAMVDILEKGLESNRKSLKLPLALARVYESSKSYDKAIQVYENLLQEYPDNIVIINNLASMLSDRTTDEASLNRAKELVDKIKDAEQPVILDTVGWVYYKAGDYTAAVEILKTVVAKAPNVNIFNYHLGMAYKAIGDKENARAFLEKSLAGGEDFDGKSEAKSALNTL